MTKETKGSYYRHREQRLDFVLKKIHKSGMDAISENERTFLERCAEEKKLELENSKV